jgi:hypothetical protein
MIVPCSFSSLFFQLTGVNGENVRVCSDVYKIAQAEKFFNLEKQNVGAKK